VNFLTTPDEEPAAVGFGIGDRALLAATLAATLPGVPMLGHGQWEGQRERYGMEYRAPRTIDPVSTDHVERYDREIAPLFRARHLFAGVADFRWFDAQSDNKAARESAYAFSNAAGSARTLVVALNSDTAAELTIQHASPAVTPSSSLTDTSAHHLPASTIADRLGVAESAGDVVELRDAITNCSLLVTTASILHNGLTVRLPAYGRVVFWGIAQHHSTPSEPWADLAAQASGELLHDPLAALAALTNGGSPTEALSARIATPAGTPATGRKRVTERKPAATQSTADPRLLTTETPAPPEAVRAIAALLGRAAAPLRPERRAATPTSAPAPEPEAHAPIESLRDHEILVEGEHSDLIRLAEHEIDRVMRRAKRARKAVREALARISSPGGDELGG